mmetsp:Transcript_33466/g.80905  ORF Transcript_33466/g.80905 Transcript_33466/m.80905 type:complete len:90 (+) Transcript_33466:72-341(+)
MASYPSSSSSTALTHLLVLFAGIAIGKSIDADELSAYRHSAGEDIWTKLRRKIKSILAGGVVLGLIVKAGSRAIGGRSSDGEKDPGGRV